MRDVVAGQSAGIPMICGLFGPGPGIALRRRLHRRDRGTILP
jgi:hypothetical protein